MIKMKQYVAIGCGRFGASVATTLYDMGYDILVIDSSEETIRDISEKVTHAVQADATDERVLESVGIGNFDVAIIAIGSDIQSSIMATLLVKESGVEHVVAKAHNEIHAKLLLKIGADKVIFPERDMGVRAAHNLVSSNILDFIELSSEYSILEITPPEDWIENTLLDINIRSEYGINVIAIKSNENINVSPKATDSINKGDILVVIGSNEDLEKFEKQAW